MAADTTRSARKHQYPLFRAARAAGATVFIAKQDKVLIAKLDKLPHKVGLLFALHGASIVFGCCDGTGKQRRNVQATSGPYCGQDLANGLRTLWGSPQVWYQPVPGGEWVAVTLEGGSFPLRRLGVGRIEVPISFSEAAAQPTQGQ